MVLPEGETDLERAALHFLHSLNSAIMDQPRQRHLRTRLPARGGLHGACTRQRRYGPAASGAPAARNQEFSRRTSTHYGRGPDSRQRVRPHGNGEPASGQAKDTEALLPEQIRGYLDRAAPRLADNVDKNKQSFLLIPASDVGKHLGEAVQKVLPDLKVVGVPAI